MGQVGLKKRTEFDHLRESVFEAAGYSEETAEKELEPRARLLAEQLAHAVFTDHMAVIEVFLDSPALQDSSLDSRDRAIIIMLTRYFLGPAALKQLNGQDRYGGSYRLKSRGRHEASQMSAVEWDTLVYHAERKVIGGGDRKVSERIERMEKVLDDPTISQLQKAVIEAVVLKDSVVGD